MEISQVAPNKYFPKSENYYLIFCIYLYKIGKYLFISMHKLINKGADKKMKYKKIILTLLITFTLFIGELGVFAEMTQTKETKDITQSEVEEESELKGTEVNKLEDEEQYIVLNVLLCNVCCMVNIT